MAISVTNPDGGAATRASAFTYLAPPTITGSSPASGPTAGGTDVVITGTGFQNMRGARFGATAGVVQQLTTTAITARTPAWSAGPVAISVTNPDGGAATRASAFTYLVDSPTITGSSPASGPRYGWRHGCGDRCSGFQTGAVVRFGATAGVVQQLTTTAITARTPAGSAGPVAIKRDQPRRRGSHARLGLHVPGAAHYYGLVAGEWPDGRLYRHVAITGTGFQTGAVVRFGATAGVAQTMNATGDHRAHTGRECRPGGDQRHQPRRRGGHARVGLHVPGAADHHGLVAGEWPDGRRHGR